MLPDSTGQPMYVWDENEYAGALEQRLLRTEYDALRRPTRQWLRINSSDEMEIGRTVFGESLKDENGAVPPFVAANNLRGQALLMLGPEGCTQAVRFDFKGNLLESRRQLLADAETHTVDWRSLLTDGVTSSHPISSPLLSTEVFTQSTQYDVLNRMTRFENWHLEGHAPAIYTPTYNRRGGLESETLSVRGQVMQAIRRIDYDAKGQRTRIQYGDPKGDVLTTTRYDYDPHTFRLVQLRTTRHEYEPNPAFPAFRSNLKDEQVLQQLLYTYDPSGNITEIEDQAYEPVFFKNQQVEPRSRYEYDAQYQLISATGRENYLANGAPKGFGKVEEMPTQNFGASDKALRTYTQRYTYDPTGNFITMQHIAADGSWTRHYETEPHSNRLTRTWLGDDEVSAVTYRYDTHGSMLNFINVPPTKNNRWDYRDMIHTLDLEGGGQAYYQYDAEKQRTRKRIVRDNGEYWERIYLEGYELYRRYVGGTLKEETETHHLFTDEQRVLIVEDVIKPAEGQQEGVLYRYQYSNHLGSVGLECDAIGRIISYEEFHPYGTTAYQARNADIKSAAKRYRYTGMERDEETGLAYHGARYYAGWLGRWGSCDPKGIDYCNSLYVYVTNRPIHQFDKDGYQMAGPESRMMQRLDIAKQRGIYPDQVGVPTADSPTWHKVLWGIQMRIALFGVGMVVTPLLSAAPFWLQTTIAVPAASYGGYSTGNAGLELVTGKKEGFGRELEPDERILAGVDFGTGIATILSMNKIRKTNPEPLSKTEPSSNQTKIGAKKIDGFQTEGELRVAILETAKDRFASTSKKVYEALFAGNKEYFKTIGLDESTIEYLISYPDNPVNLGLAMEKAFAYEVSTDPFLSQYISYTANQKSYGGLKPDFWVETPTSKFPLDITTQKSFSGHLEKYEGGMIWCWNE